MKKTLKLSFILTFFFITSCYYDSEESLNPATQNSCDLTNVTFSATVKPILQASCYGCHSNQNAASSGDGIKLENYSDVQNIAKNGKLMGVLKHSSGYKAMPLGGAKLNDCDISKLQTWVNAGMINN